MTDRLGERISEVELLHEFTVIVQEETGLKDLFAAQVAEAILRGLRRRRGGEEVYIPAEDRSARDDAIRRAYNGRNMEEVMARYGVSRATVYRAAK